MGSIFVYILLSLVKVRSKITISWFASVIRAPGKVKKMNQNIKLAENTLGQRIKAQRIKMGYTQEQLAEIMCVPKSTISAYENDKVDIKGSIITELSGILHTTPDYLLGYMDEDALNNKEVIDIFQKITDPMIKEMLLKQMRALI